MHKALAAYRYRIFIERLGWSLPVKEGEEEDQFDRPDTVYVVAQEKDGSLSGCARLLPTTRPYLLGEVFPGLLWGMPIPRSPEVWELSRFAAAPLSGGSGMDQAKLTRGLLAAAVRAAFARGAKRLITVSPLGVERLLYRMGVHSHRAGPPSMIDGKPVFACWIELDEQTFAALGIAQPGRDAGQPEALQTRPAPVGDSDIIFQGAAAPSVVDACVGVAEAG
nr:acyl-homoserine-lactone synthase [Noviherbaspirillum humi]